MLPDRVSNPGPLTYESGALPIALRGPAIAIRPKIGCKGRQSDSVQIMEVSILQRNICLNMQAA